MAFPPDSREVTFTAPADGEYWFSVATLDRQGRMLIPPKLRQYAEIDAAALMIGMVKKLELWSPRRWEGYEASEASRFDTHERVMELRL